MSITILSSDDLEKEILKHYNAYTKQTMKQLGTGVTYTSQLTDICNQLFGKHKYRGTFSSDTLPKLTKARPYAIVNVDKSTQPGSHWVACCWLPGGMLVYDSFGRKTSKLMKNIYKKYKTIDTDYDAEQPIKQKNCGSRCIAWLRMCDTYGTNIAKMI